MQKMPESMREHPGDLVSDLLELARVRSALSGGLRAGGDWAVAFPATRQVKFWGIRHGRAWIDFGTGAPLAAQAGDIFLFHAPGPHVLASTPGVPALPLEQLAGSRAGAVLRHGDAGRDDFFMIGGKVDLDPGCAPLLFGGLPPVLRLDGNAAHAPGVHWILDRLVAERDAALPGAAAACAQLAQLMLIQILRAHLAEPERLGSGPFRALADRRLAPALRLMHGDPGRPWRLPELAAACAMSRAGFAGHFRTVAGAAPLQYLAELRMRLAQRRLREGDTGIARLAQEFGYGSESAFSHAFKRVTGMSPKQFRLGAA
jgi:AraC-like DNA-binding protein